MINGLQPEIKAKVVVKDPGTPKQVMRRAIMAKAVEKRKQTAQINLIEEASASHISAANEATYTYTRGSPCMEQFPLPVTNCYSQRSPSRDSMDHCYRSPSHDRGRWPCQGCRTPSREHRPLPWCTYNQSSHPRQRRHVRWEDQTNCGCCGLNISLVSPIVLLWADFAVIAIDTIILVPNALPTNRSNRQP